MIYIQNRYRKALVILVFTGLGGLLPAEETALRPTASEQQILDEYRREATHAGSEIRTFASQTEAKMPEDFAPWWIRGQRNTIGENGRAQALGR